MELRQLEAFVAVATELHFGRQWNPSRAHNLAVARFVRPVLTADLPPGWYTQPDHLRHIEPQDEDEG